MAEGFTTARASKILTDNIKSTTYIGLSSTVPNKDGSNFTEPASSTGYRRAPIGTLNTSKSAQIANDDIIFVFEALADCGSFNRAAEKLFLSPPSVMKQINALEKHLELPCLPAPAKASS